MVLMCLGIGLSDDVGLRARSSSSDGNLKARTMCIFFLICLMPSSDATVISSEQDLSRINFGVSFRLIAEAPVMSGTWWHSYVVEAPTNVLNDTHRDIILGEKVEDKRRRWMDQCLSKMYHDSEGLETSSGNIGGTEHSRHGVFCAKFAPIIQMLLRMVKMEHLFLKDQNKAIFALLPNGDRMPFGNASRYSRGLIDGLGLAGHYLFGLATDKEIHRVEGNIKLIAESYRTQTAVFKKDLANLASVSTVTNARLENLMKFMNRSFLNNMEHWTTLAEDANSKFDFAADLSFKGLNLLSTLGRLSDYQTSFLDAMEVLAGGRLPSMLVTPEMLHETIREISAELKGFSLIYTHPAFYYQHAKVTYGNFGSKIFINVPFLLSASAARARVYEMERFAQPVVGKKGATLILNGVQPGLMLTEGGSLYAELTESELTRVKMNSEIIPEKRVLRRVDGTTSCAVALFLDRRAGVKKFCNYSIVLDSLVSGVQHLSGTKFLMTEVLEYHVNCGAGFIRHECQTQCVVSLGPSCALNTSNEYITPVYGNGTEFSQSFSVAAPVLNMLFSDSDLQMINGENTFHSLPEIDFPELKFFESSAKEFVSNDDKLSVDLRKAMQQIKEDKVIVHSVADSIVLGSQPINLDCSWNTTLGYSFMACAVVVILLSLQVIHLSLRLKVLTTTLTILKNGIRVDGQILENMPTVPKLRLSYASQTSVSVPLQNSNDIHVKIVESMADKWAFILLGLIGGAIIVLVVRWWFRKYCRDLRQSKISTWLALQFTVVGGEGRNLVIKIQKIPVLPADLSIVTCDAISNFELKGCFGRTLSYLWDAEIQNEFSNERFAIKQSVNLKLYQAYIARQLLASRFFVKPIYIDGKNFVKAKFRRGTLSRVPSAASMKRVFQPAPSAPADEAIEMTEFI